MLHDGILRLVRPFSLHQLAGCSEDVNTDYVLSAVSIMLARMNPDKKILMIKQKYGKDSEKAKRIGFDGSKDISIKHKGMENLFVIYVHDKNKGTEINPYVASQIVKKIAERFDFVLCDAGKGIQVGFEKGELFAPDKVFYVIDGQMDSLDQFLYLHRMPEKYVIPVAGFVLDFDHYRPEYSIDCFYKSLGVSDESKVFRKNRRLCYMP